MEEKDRRHERIVTMDDGGFRPQYCYKGHIYGYLVGTKDKKSYFYWKKTKSFA